MMNLSRAEKFSSKPRKPLDAPRVNPVSNIPRAFCTFGTSFVKFLKLFLRYQ